MNSITRKAYGKINLSLDVLGRRADGYHLVKMVMQTVNVYDTVTIEKTAGSSIIVRTGAADIPAGPDNLAYRAAQVMKEQYHIPDGLRITIEKRIPVAAGMAGGSTDAAAVFTGIRELFPEYCIGSAPACRHSASKPQDHTQAVSMATSKFPILPRPASELQDHTQAAADVPSQTSGNIGENSFDENGKGTAEDNRRLQALALPLGADIPYCITGGTQLSEGIGEKLTPLPAAPSAGKESLIIVKPDLYVSTGWVYHAFDTIPAGQIHHPDVDAQVAAIQNQDLVTMASCCGNVLEQQTAAEHPVIHELEEFLKENGALQAIMTGSGPTVFAIFDSPITAAAAFEKLQAQTAYQTYQKFLTEMCN